MHLLKAAASSLIYCVFQNTVGKPKIMVQVFFLNNCTNSLISKNKCIFSRHELHACFDRGFSYDVTTAILVLKNKETAAILVYQTNPPGIGLYFYAKIFLCLSKPIWRWSRE